MKPSTLLDLLTQRLDEKTPAVYFHSEFENKEALTCKQIWIQSRKMATVLRHSEPDLKCTLICLGNSADFVAAFFGCLLARRIPVPLPSAGFQKPKEFRERVKRICGITQADVFIGTPEAFALLQGLNLVRAVNPAEANSVDPLASQDFPTVIPTDTAFIQFSSGSTEEPKGVTLSHSNILANLLQIQQGMAATPGDIGCSWLPFFHDMGWIGGFLSPLFTRYPIHILSPIDFLSEPLAWLKLIDRSRASLILGPDFAYRMCCRKIPHEERVKLDLSQVRLALSGGEPVSPRTCREFKEAFKVAKFRENALFPVYGLAENSLAVTFPSPGSEVVATFQEVTGAETISCGKPLPGVRLKITDADFLTLGERQIGKILIQSPSMTSGYFGNHALSSELFHDGWLKTGDLGFLHEGNLHVVDREKDLIVIRGRNLFPADLERKISEVSQNSGNSRDIHFGRCAVVSVYDPVEQQETVHVVIESREILPWKRSLIKSQIEEKLGESCPISSHNIHVVPSCHLPRTSSGKVKRYQVKLEILSQKVKRAERFFLWNLGVAKFNLILTLARFRQRRSPRAALKLESYLVLHLARITGNSRRRVQMSTPFSKLKMDSLAVMELHSRLHKDLASIPLHQLIDFQNLTELQDHLLEFYPQEVENWVQHDRHL